MRFDNVAVLSVQAVDAPHRIASGFINARLRPVMDRLGIHVDLLGKVAGVQARRFWDPGVQPSQAATLAAEAVLAESGIDRSRIGVLVNTSVCRDFLEPATACLVHGNLGLSPDCLNFDLGNANSRFFPECFFSISDSEFIHGRFFSQHSRFNQSGKTEE